MLAHCKYKIIQNHHRSEGVPRDCTGAALEKLGIITWEEGNVCYFLPLPSAIYYSYHVLADINNTLAFHGLCRDTYPKEGAQGKQGGSSLGAQREQVPKEYCRAWVGKSRRAGAAAGISTERKLTAERLGKESWVWKHSANAGVQEETGIVHKASEG